MDNIKWDPKHPGHKVYIKGNPGRQGETTGLTKERGGRLYVAVAWGPNETSWKLYDQLDVANIHEESQVFQELGTPDDLRRIIILEKIKGELTNIFYSMESSGTDFYTHQFKPVIKFLDSSAGRLLIADEVGLGKTIEAIYIWKELQVRENARRLLIVCPAMLRDKWAEDLKAHFNLYPEIVDAKKLLNSAQTFVQTGKPDSYIYIVSYEGTRCKNWESIENPKDAKIKLAQLLDSHPASGDVSIFDLVIIDESHYLRNPGTANNKLGELLRDSSKHLVLLTATPIQIKSDNLYQLLKLISPDDFFDSRSFESMLSENKGIVDSLRMMSKLNPDMEFVERKISEVIQSKYYLGSERLKNLLNQISQKIERKENITPEQQAQFCQILESASLFGQFMTRSLKREVMKEHRVQRKSQTLTVNFTDLENSVYQYISGQIRLQAQMASAFSIFKLMARQKQMASCMVAAMKDWHEKEILKDMMFSTDTSDEDQESIYEIFGSHIDEFQDNSVFELKRGSENEINIFKNSIKKNPIPIDEISFKKFMQELYDNDTKYNQLIKFLRKQLSDNPCEKFVLFAFYRKTLMYLEERLKLENIETLLILGGMKREEKQESLKNFKNNKKILILLSSEVGSEGIDLQFCHYLINYDLPWNPMRVEQRIGRLDRLNQKSPVISIINFSLKNTIEEYILEKLYERIKIFKESIGDIEEILGEKTEEIIFDLIRLDLNEEQKKKEAERKIIAYAKQIEQQRQLENEAMNLVAFSDYILNSINNSYNNNRWLSPDEIYNFVDDFFKLMYPGTIIALSKNKVGLYEINLSQEAKAELRLFIHKTNPSIRTILDRHKASCLFDARLATSFKSDKFELIQPTHPLIQWIKKYYEESNKLYNQSACKILTSKIKSKIDIKAGIYIYLIYLWKFEGIKSSVKLAYRVISIDRRTILSASHAELLINECIFRGSQQPNANNLVDMNEVINTYNFCKDMIDDDFFEDQQLFEAENNDKCNNQENNILAFSNRRIQNLEERIERFSWEGKISIIPAIKGQINKIRNDQAFNLKRIEDKRSCNCISKMLASGFIFIED